jgi:hypothetical protein
LMFWFEKHMMDDVEENIDLYKQSCAPWKDSPKTTDQIDKTKNALEWALTIQIPEDKDELKRVVEAPSDTEVTYKGKLWYKIEIDEESVYQWKLIYKKRTYLLLIDEHIPETEKETLIDITYATKLH